MRATSVIVVVMAGAASACGSSEATPSVDASGEAGGAPPVRWTNRYGGAGDERPVAIDVDASREIFVGAMTTSTSFDFGGASFGCASSCVAFAAIDPEGATIWARPLATGGTARLNAMAADVAGGVVVAGDLFGTADLSGPELVAPSCTSASSPDVFLARFDTSGFFLWQRRFGDCDAQTASALAIDGTDIVVAGAYRSTIDFGLGPLAALGARDLFLARIDAGGTALSAKGFGVSSSASLATEIRAVAVDASSDVFVAGSSDDIVDLGGGPLAPRGGRDVFVAELDVNSVHMWSGRFGDAENQDVLSIAADGSGGVVVGGVTQGSIDFGGGALNGNGVYVVDLAAGGTHRWSRVFASPSASVGRVRVDASGGVLVAGTFTGTIDFGGGALSSGAADSSAAFLAKLDVSGAHLWSRAFVGSAGNVSAADVVVDVRGETILVGAFTGALDAFTALGGDDLLLEKLARP